MIWVGVDPGKKGGYAWIWEDTVRAMPWDDVFFCQDMHCLKETGEVVVAAVEKVGARPGQGTVSMFSFGKSAGYIEGVLAALGIGYQLVPPAAWKKEFSLIGREKRECIAVAKRLFPQVSLLPGERHRVESDGMGDSLLIAEWCRRKMGC